MLVGVREVFYEVGLDIAVYKRDFYSKTSGGGLAVATSLYDECVLEDRRRVANKFT